MPKKPELDEEMIRKLASITSSVRSAAMPSSPTKLCLKCGKAGNPPQISCGSCDSYICDKCHWCEDHHHEIRMCDRCRTPFCRDCDEMDICHECMVSHCQRCTNMDECISCHEVFCLVSDDMSQVAEDECAAYCSGADCDAVLCRECWSRCKRCGAILCDSCSRSCGRCKVIVCQDDERFLVSCDNCGQAHCLDCISKVQPCVKCNRMPGKRLRRVVHLRLKPFNKCRGENKDKVASLFGKLSELAADGICYKLSCSSCASNSIDSNLIFKGVNYARSTQKSQSDVAKGVPSENDDDDNDQRIARLKAEAAARAAELELYNKINEEEKLALERKKKKEDKKKLKENVVLNNGSSDSVPVDTPKNADKSIVDDKKKLNRKQENSAKAKNPPKDVKKTIEKKSSAQKVSPPKDEKALSTEPNTDIQPDSGEYNSLDGMQKVERKKEAKNKKKGKLTAMNLEPIQKGNYTSEEAISNLATDDTPRSKVKNSSKENKVSTEQISKKIPVEKTDEQLRKFLTRVLHENYQPTTMEVRKYFAGRLEESLVTDVFNTAGVGNISAAVKACAEMLSISIPRPRPRPIQKSSSTKSQSNAALNSQSNLVPANTAAVQNAASKSGSLPQKNKLQIPDLPITWADKSKHSSNSRTEVPVRIMEVIEEEILNQKLRLEQSKSFSNVAELEKKMKDAIDAEDEPAISDLLESIKGVSGFSTIRRAGKKAIKSIKQKQSSTNEDPSAVTSESIVESLQLNEPQQTLFSNTNLFPISNSVVSAPLESVPIAVIPAHKPPTQKPIPIGPIVKPAMHDVAATLTRVPPFDALLGMRSRSSPSASMQPLIKISEIRMLPCNLREIIIYLDFRVVGWIIGKGGTRIREIQVQSGSRMWVDQHLEDGRPMPDSMLRSLHIQGSESQVQHATALVTELVESAPVYSYPRSSVTSPSPPIEHTLLQSSIFSTPFYQDLSPWNSGLDSSSRFLTPRSVSTPDDFSLISRNEEPEEKFKFEVRRPDQLLAPQIIRSNCTTTPSDSGWDPLRRNEQLSPLGSLDFSLNSHVDPFRFAEKREFESYDDRSVLTELPGLIGFGTNGGLFNGMRGGAVDSERLTSPLGLDMRAMPQKTAIKDDDAGIDDILQSVNSVAWLG